MHFGSKVPASILPRVFVFPKLCRTGRREIVEKSKDIAHVPKNRARDGERFDNQERIRVTYLGRRIDC